MKCNKSHEHLGHTEFIVDPVQLYISKFLICSSLIFKTQNIFPEARKYRDMSDFSTVLSFLNFYKCL